ncbi:MAG: hypothetical protein ACR2OV_12170 [Hyphomicrobiaceae bacterium]
MVIALAVLRSVGFLVTGSASAQDSVRLIVPPAVVAKPGQETKLGVNFKPKIPTGRSLLLRIIGFDPRVQLLAGYRVNKRSWAVPLASAQDLKFKLPQSVTKDQKIQIVLTSIDGDLVAQVQTTVRIDAKTETFASTVPASTVTRSGEVIAPRLLQEGTAPDQQAPGQATPDQQTQGQQTLGQQTLGRQKQAKLTAPPSSNKTEPVTREGPGAAAPALSPEAKARAERLLKRGNDFLSQGQITQARLLYKMAAELGLAAAALALGSTYDPQELDRLGVVGITPDLEKAKEWYGVAARLGSTKAAARLSASSQR